MANQMELFPVLAPPDRNGGAGAPVVLGSSGSSLEALVVDSMGSFRLVSSPLPDGDSPRVVATFRRIPPKHANEAPQLMVVPADPAFRLNGLAPIKLKSLRPGDLISLFQDSWLVVRRYRPEPQGVPSHLAQKPCPVCQSPLRVTSVCQCACCPTYFHLENPAGAPDSESELNCYLSLESCPVCGEKISREERLYPEPRSLRF